MSPAWRCAGPRIRGRSYTGEETGWEYVCEPGFSPNSIGSISLAAHDGTPYVAFQDVSPDYKATVMKYTGEGATGWEYVGSRGFSAGGIDRISLKIYNGLLYVAYKDGSFEECYKATVMKYTEEDGWKYLGNQGFSADEADGISLDIYNGVPYVAYKDSSIGDGEAAVMVFGGADWIPVGDPGFSTGQIDNPSLVVYNGVPYVAFCDVTDGLTVWKYAP